MTLIGTLRGLVRRWYIVVPGMILAVAVAIGAFTLVTPGYERSATRLLLPGLGTVPEGATNPYLFLGGLTQAADILVRSVGGDETIGELVAAHPGLEVSVTRDPTSSGPVILLTVTAESDADAEMALDTLIAQSTRTLERLQTEQNVRPTDRITLTTLTHSPESTLQQRTRILVSVGAGLGVAVLTVILASLVDGLARTRQARSRKHHTDTRDVLGGGSGGSDPDPRLHPAESPGDNRTVDADPVPAPEKGLIAVPVVMDRPNIPLSWPGR